MKQLKWLSLGAVVLSAGFLSASEAQAGTRVNINIGGGGGYCQPAYYPRPYYAPPVAYRPAYYGPPRAAYYPPPAYRTYRSGYGYGYNPRPVYYRPVYR